MNQELHSSSSTPIDQHYIHAVVEVLELHDKAQGLDHESLRAIACEAIRGGHLQDAAWLEQRLQASQESPTTQPHSSTPEHVHANLPSQEEGSAPTEANPSSLPSIQVSAPAQITCQEDLDKVVAQHKEWMAAVLDPRKDMAEGRANLRGADLSGLNLQGVNLSCADFSEANLTGAQLSYANLSRCKFIHTNLQKANLTGAKLKKAQFEGADLSEANLNETDLSEVDLSVCKLHNTKLPQDDH